MKSLLAAILLFISSSIAWSQPITITESAWLDQSTQLNNRTGFMATQASLPALTPLLSASGADQTWDLTLASYTSLADTGTATVLTYPGGYPAESDPDFVTATHVIKIVPLSPTSPTIYEFLRVTSSGEWVLGTSEDSLGTPKKVFGYNPPKQMAAFPMTYQTSWSSVSVFDGPAFPLSITITDSNSAVVDGYGTLITPSPSTSTPALRVKVKDVHSTSLGGYVVQTSTTFTYQWLTTGLYSATLDANATQTAFTGAYYWTPTSNAVSAGSASTNDDLNLSLSANPATTSGTTVNYSLPSGGATHIELIDALGRTVRTLQNGYAPTGQHAIAIDSHSLTPGTYFVRIEANGLSAMRGLVVQ